MSFKFSSIPPHRIHVIHIALPNTSTTTNTQLKLFWHVFNYVRNLIFNNWYNHIQIYRHYLGLYSMRMNWHPLAFCNWFVIVHALSLHVGLPLDLSANDIEVGLINPSRLVALTSFNLLYNVLPNEKSKKKM